jgi:hypothetical protein
MGCLIKAQNGRGLYTIVREITCRWAHRKSWPIASHEQFECIVAHLMSSPRTSSPDLQEINSLVELKRSAELQVVEKLAAMQRQVDALEQRVAAKTRWTVSQK